MQNHPFDGINLKDHPSAYRIGRGEYGIFHAEPYKSELLPLWGFKNERIARQAAEAIYNKYKQYRKEEDFVGMDVARKFLRMGYTRARRYAKYPGGKKYNEDGTVKEVTALDEEKQRAAEIFDESRSSIVEDPKYQRLKDEFIGE
ncbi:DUF4385 family protein [Pontibacillus salicampi]|uniref:DUF4385 family protein n=1 Tax=Pontibacillus salicampi TaxID=1449801 RepID=A0ABV6LN69_9BACI